MKCEIDDARMFLQVMKESSDPLAILREALSNSYDAEATRARVEMRVHSANTIDLEISDNGHGISRSEFRYFFGLGFGNKVEPQFIGNKGLGTKLYFNGNQVEVLSKLPSGKMFRATLDDPMSSLESGHVPEYEVAETKNVMLPYRHGAVVKIRGLKAKSKAPMLSIDSVANYLKWYTVAGSCSHLFSAGRSGRFQVNLRRMGKDSATVKISGHELPGLKRPSLQDYVSFAAAFAPFRVKLVSDEGIELGCLEVAGAIVGPQGHIVTDRRVKKRFKGVFLSKDYFIVKNVSQEVFSGTGEWQSVHIVANCQELDLTMSRDDFVNKTDGSAYAEALSALRELAVCLRRGEPFRYRGRTVETAENCAGALYSRLKAMKRADSLLELENLKALDLFSVSASPRTSLADDGGPVFQPLGRVGLMLYFQALVSKHQLFAELGKPGEPKRYRVLGYAEESGGHLVLQRKSHGTWSRPLFFKPVMCLTDDAILDAKNVDGLVCWSNSLAPHHIDSSLSIIVLGDAL